MRMVWRAHGDGVDLFLHFLEHSAKVVVFSCLWKLLGLFVEVKVVDVAPIYSAIARAAHVRGVVILEAVLNTQGAVQSVRVLRSIPLLDQAAVDAVQQWRYTPGLLNGRAVPVVMTVTVNFRLE